MRTMFRAAWAASLSVVLFALPGAASAQWLKPEPLPPTSVDRPLRAQ